MEGVVQWKMGGGVVQWKMGGGVVQWKMGGGVVQWKEDGEMERVGIENGESRKKWESCEVVGVRGE